MKKITNNILGLALGNPNFEAHPEFWEAYETAKNEKLFKLFGEKLIIEKEVEIIKEKDEIAREIRENNIYKLIKDRLDKEYLEILNNGWNPYLPDEPEWSKNNISHNINSFFNNYIFSSYTLADNALDNTFTLFLPTLNKKVRFEKGMKITKILKYFISDKKELDFIQTKISQILNTKKTKGTLCLSIHPADYLTASVNDCNWTSCFNIIERGCWCASTLSLVSSPNTMIAYLKTNEDMVLGANTTWNNKRWRAYVSLNKDNELVHIGKNYPYTSTDLMKTAIEMVGELTKKEYKNFKVDESRVRIFAPNNFYNDVEGEDLYTAITDDWKREVYGEHIQISDIGAICPICGEPYSDHEWNFVCDECDNSHYCLHCDEAIRPDEETYIDSEEGYVCQSCLDNDYWCCVECEEYHHYTNTTTVISGAHSWETKHICRGCLDRLIDNEEIEYCDYCNEWIYTDLVTCCCEEKRLEREKKRKRSDLN